METNKSIVTDEEVSALATTIYEEWTASCPLGKVITNFARKHLEAMKQKDAQLKIAVEALEEIQASFQESVRVILTSGGAFSSENHVDIITVSKALATLKNDHRE